MYDYCGICMQMRVSQQYGSGSPLQRVGVYSHESRSNFGPG